MALGLLNIMERENDNKLPFTEIEKLYLKEKHETNQKLFLMIGKATVSFGSIV